jgi:hypothetical protein
MAELASVFLDRPEYRPVFYDDARLRATSHVYRALNSRRSG